MDLADVRWARWGGCCLVDKLKKPPAVVSVVRWLYAFQTANRIYQLHQAIYSQALAICLVVKISSLRPPWASGGIRDNWSYYPWS